MFAARAIVSRTGPGINSQEQTMAQERGNPNARLGGEGAGFRPLRLDPRCRSLADEQALGGIDPHFRSTDVIGRI